jgi:transposase
MARLMLTDEFWLTLREMMLEQGIYDKRHFRKTVEGILYRMRTGCPWRDLPRQFSKWNSVYQQFNRWSANDKLIGMFKVLVDDPDLEWGFIDSSIVKAHQHSAGAAGGGDQGIGKSRGGLTTKIHMSVDSCGFPLNFEITGGEVHDSKAAPELIEKMPVTECVIGDKGYDSEALRRQIEERGSRPIIARKSNSRQGNDDVDWYLYKCRHLIENLFARIKHFRAIATRYDKLKRNYLSMVALACGFLWLPM